MSLGRAVTLVLGLGASIGGAVATGISVSSEKVISSSADTAVERAGGLTS